MNQCVPATNNMLFNINEHYRISILRLNATIHIENVSKFKDKQYITIFFRKIKQFWNRSKGKLSLIVPSKVCNNKIFLCVMVQNRKLDNVCLHMGNFCSLFCVPHVILFCIYFFKYFLKIRNIIYILQPNISNYFKYIQVQYMPCSLVGWA